MFLSPPAVLAAILFAGGAAADEAIHPGFTGTWRLDLSRSELEIDPPTSSTFVILHAEPEWRLERTHVYDGKRDLLVMELRTDGSPSITESGRFKIESSLAWDDSDLVLRWSQSVSSKQVANGVVRYSIAADGQTFIAEERMVSDEGTHNNRWVFARGD
jgi:hypothetical protein